MTEIKEAKAPVAKATNTAVAKKKPQTMKDYVNVMMPEIKKALPSAITPERFTRIVLSAISNNKQLQECSPQSFLAGMMNAAQLGLEPNTALGQAYLIPYRNKGTLEAQFQIGYKGLIDLAYRSGQVKTIYAEAVYENDEFEYELGLNPKLKHIPALKDRGEPIAYYAVWRNRDYGEDAFGFEVMSKEDVERHARRFSKAYNSGPWRDHFDSMAKKTVIIQALKYAPLSVETREIQSTDGRVMSGISANMAEIPSDVEVDIEYAEVVDDETGEVNAAA